jgi:predicted Zn-dependent protease
MRHSLRFRALTLATLAAFSLSCVSTQLPPISQSGPRFRPLADERALWQESRDEEEKLLGSVQLYQDPLLEAYLEEIVGRLNPRGMASNPEIRYRVRVIEDPTLNAFAYPHGSLYVHTGLLARMENEDQLATVLGHEMTHVENRHMVRYQRSQRNKLIGLTIAAVAAAVVLSELESDALSDGDWVKATNIDFFGELIVSLGLQLAFLASVNGYGRGLELEADVGGFAKLSAAGYDLAQAPRVYELLMEERGDPRRAEAFFFGSHPRLAERLQNTRGYLASHPRPVTAAAGAAIADDRFARRLRSVVRDDARLNLEVGRIGLAAGELDRVSGWMPEDPETRFLVGRLRHKEATVEKDPVRGADLHRQAVESFRAAIRLDDRRPDAHRELGFLLADSGERNDRREACRELRRYVDLAPDADDTDRVDDYILELKHDGQCR